MDLKIVGENGYQTLYPLRKGSGVAWEKLRIGTPEDVGGFDIRYLVRTCGVLKPEHRAFKQLGGPQRSFITIMSVVNNIEQVPTSYTFSTLSLACRVTPDAGTDPLLYAKIVAWFIQYLHRGGEPGEFARMYTPEGTEPGYICPTEEDLAGF